MKKIFIGIIMALMLSSCGYYERSFEPYTDSKGVTTQKVTDGVNKITVDGHEYLMFYHAVYGGSSISVVHSASCPCHNEEE